MPSRPSTCPGPPDPHCRMSIYSVQIGRISHTTYFILHSLHYTLHTSQCTVLHLTLYTTHRSVQCTLHTAHHTVQSTLHTTTQHAVQSTLHTTTQHTVQSTLHTKSPVCTLHSVYITQCVLYIVHTTHSVHEVAGFSYDCGLNPRQVITTIYLFVNSLWCPSLPRTAKNKGTV